MNLGIGQGDLLATPLQMATVAATIANRGRVVRPKMLLSSDDTIGEMNSVEEPPQIVGLSEEDWESMVDSMEDVVHRGGKGFRGNGTAWAYIGQKIGYRMAGKSGTAQVVEINQGEVYDEENCQSFVASTHGLLPLHRLITQQLRLLYWWKTAVAEVLLQPRSKGRD